MGIVSLWPSWFSKIDHCAETKCGAMDSHLFVTLGQPAHSKTSSGSLVAHRKREKTHVDAPLFSGMLVSINTKRDTAALNAIYFMLGALSANKQFRRRQEVGVISRDKRRNMDLCHLWVSAKKCSESRDRWMNQVDLLQVSEHGPKFCWRAYCNTRHFKLGRHIAILQRIALQELLIICIHFAQCHSNFVRYTWQHASKDCNHMQSLCTRSKILRRQSLNSLFDAMQYNFKSLGSYLLLILCIERTQDVAAITALFTHDSKQNP